MHGLRVITALAALVLIVVMVLLVYEVVGQALAQHPGVRRSDS